MWFNILGLLELAVVLSIAVAAAPNAARLLIISPSTEAVSLLPVVLLPLTMIPLVAALHITSLRILKRHNGIPTNTHADAGGWISK
jgi:high-affinity K+ transport system ATPase subunit B